MDEDGLELQPQEPNSFFDATGITWVVLLPKTTKLGSWLSSGRIARHSCWYSHLGIFYPVKPTFVKGGILLFPSSKMCYPHSQHSHFSP